MSSKPQLLEDDKEASIPLQLITPDPESTIDLQENGVSDEDSEIEGGSNIKQTGVDQKSGWRRYAGLVCALLCSLFFSGTVLIAKVLHQDYGHHQFVITMYRYAGILLPSSFITIYFHKYGRVEVFQTLWPLTKKGNRTNLFLYLMQGIFGCTATIFRFISLAFIPIADSTVVFSSYTVVVTILAHICLGEPCGVVSILLAIMTAAGVVIIARPPLITGESEFNLVYLEGSIYAILALLCTSAFLILMRKIRKTHFALMMLVGGAWGVFEAGILAVIFGGFTLPQNSYDLMLILSLASLTFLGQVCFVLAIKYEHAGPLAIARTSEVIYAFIWQFLFLGVIPDFISISGGILVITAVVVTGYCKYLASLPTQNRIRLKLSFLLK